jgi:HdeA/HdeB family
MDGSKLVAACAAVAFGVTFPNWAKSADTIVDMSKVTCAQLLDGSADSLEESIWLSGYYNGLHKNTKLNLSQFKHNAELVVNECRANPKKTVMQTINALLHKKK